MRGHGVPSEVLIDAKQFTGRFTKPRSAEVLFWRICGTNGSTARLTKPPVTDHHGEGGAAA